MFARVLEILVMIDQLYDEADVKFKKKDEVDEAVLIWRGAGGRCRAHDAAARKHLGVPF